MPLLLERRIVAEEAGIAVMAEAVIVKGSQSFAAASKLFDADTRRSAMMLYAWCRHCDDVVDGQELGFRPDRPMADTGTPQERIAALDQMTRSAFAGDAVADPTFRALQLVATRHGLPLDLALAHLEGFRMDVDGRRYDTIEETLDYCHHVAGVVGVMMAKIMGAGGEDTLLRAADLGLAFQLTNIARDIVRDAEVGRVYIPADWLDAAGLSRDAIAHPENRGRVALLARRLVDLAEPYYASARIGIDALPRRSAWAVATALGVYREIGLRVVELGDTAWDARVSTSKLDKLSHVGRAAFVALSRRSGKGPRRGVNLWTHQGR